MSCNIKTNFQKIDTFENEKHPKEKPKEKGIWPKIKGKFNKSMFYFYIHSTVWCVETSVLTVITSC